MPASDPITAVANAVEVLVDDIAKPLIDSDQAQSHDNEFTQACQQINDAFALPDTDAPRAINALAVRLCIDNGHPTGGVGAFREVPTDFLEALLTIAAERRRDTAKTNDLLHALTTK